MQQDPTSAEFSEWVARFRTKALRLGVSGLVYDRAMSAIVFDHTVIQKDRHQPEHTQTIWGYLDRAVSEQRVQNGQTSLQNNAALLDQIASQYGVPAEILCAIWGLESAYGSVRGEFSVIQSLATLAFDGRRAGLFEAQLIAALNILQAGDISSPKMLGSWAGAMGHTQFMPTSFLKRAVDFDGDGRREIWSDDPCDALASTARYLAVVGWQNGGPIIAEVTLNSEFDYALAGLGTTKTAAEWAQFGVSHGPRLQALASILLPAGASGPVLMVFHNFGVILQYNRAIPYALAVAQLAGRIKGTPGFKAKWPRDQRALTSDEQREFQENLCLKGFDTQGTDGIFGPNTFAALRQFQAANDLVADGFPTLELLQRLRE